ncbi:unnamed protein product [Notodromas monacha]|uniref:WD repeat domain phosphoinositide-interacting protein 2 n=1 Tax=Notodromas monacha TaxID=399045 RepID=A0A7R9GBH9_9CRUS|nr:unnamed protein product [Notodromas monacha]CAG0915083.1 unnamed protein product [Notodromas monacha]
MNLASQGGDPLSGLYFVNFNQDCSSLSVGTKKGYRLFSLNSVDDIDEEIHRNDKEEICIVERLFSSSLIAIVGLSSPRKLRVCHLKKGTEICQNSYSNTILSVKLNRSRLVVCLEEAIHIHSMRDMKVLHTIKDTPPNPTGLCALSPHSDNCILAYPGASHAGEVQIFDTVTMVRTDFGVFIQQVKMMIPAHAGPLAALSFDTPGKKLATASEKGTVIRVFNVADGTKLFEFRRGMKRCVSIYSLAFSPDSLFLSASSNTETVHIFKLEQFSRVLTASASYLPTQVTEVFSQGRDFATVHLPYGNVRNICAFTVLDGLGDDKPGLPYSHGDSDRFRELGAAAEQPPPSLLKIHDDDEFPPMGSQVAE